MDLLVIALLAGAAALGWRRGLVVSALGGAAFAGAGLVGGLLAAAIGGIPPVLAFVLVGVVATIPVAIRARQITEAVERRAGDGMIRADRVGGALLGVCVSVVFAWFIAAVASVAPGDSTVLSAVRGSSFLTAFVESVPPSGTLGSVVLRSGVVPSLNGPLVLASEPDESSARAPQVLAAQPSVLQVSGEACGSIVTGTGWVAGPGLIVTNAHVVAGQSSTTLSGGPEYDGFTATVTAFDPVNDVAVLTADGRALPPPIPLRLGVRHDQPAAVIGFPKGGVRRVIPARIDRIATTAVEPIGGGTAQQVPVLAFRAEVQHGNSGGPVLAEDGTALGLVVAKGLGQRIEAAYGIASRDLQQILVRGARREPVSTGRCLGPEDQISGD